MKLRFRTVAVTLVSLLAPIVALAANPSISSLTPNSGAVGASITIAGANFGSTQGTSTVKFNGTGSDLDNELERDVNRSQSSYRSNDW